MKERTRPLGVLVVLLLLLFGLSVRAEDAYGPIRRGENLWGIAREVYPDQGVTRDQVMLALLRANPQAFGSPCNANAPLRTGVLLRVPPLSEVRALSPADARREFRRQAQEWKDHLRTGRPLVCPPASKPASAEAPGQEPRPRPQAAKPAAPPKQPPSAAPFPPAPAPPSPLHPPAPAATKPPTPPKAQPPAPPLVPRPQAAPPAEQPRVKARPSPAAEWRHLWREIEPELARHERLDGLGILVVLGLVAGILYWRYRKGRAREAGAPTARAPRAADAFAALSVTESLGRLKSDASRGLATAEAQRRLGRSAETPCRRSRSPCWSGCCRSSGARSLG